MELPHGTEADEVGAVMARVYPPVPNRLVITPPELYEYVDQVLNDGQGHERKRLRAVLRMAYGRGYTDGYRDGHTDAENGHDERFTVSLT